MRYFLSLTGSSGFGGLRATDGRDPPDDRLENRFRDTTFVTPWARVEGVAAAMLRPSASAAHRGCGQNVHQAQRAGSIVARASRTACRVPLAASPLLLGWG